MASRFLLGCLFVISIVSCSTAAFAGKVELSTNHPSPYGEYTNLKSTADSYFATTSGTVGVGTTNAISKLDVLGTLSVGNAATAGAIGKVQISTDGLLPINNRLTFGTDGTGWKFAIGKNQAGTVTDYMTFQDNGNLGIGTTSAAVKLEVAGTIRSTQPYWFGRISTAGGTNYYMGLVTTESSGVTLSGGNTLTVPTTGLYLVHVRQLVQVSAAAYQHVIQNATTVAYAYSAAGQLDLQSTVVVSCSAGDTFKFYYANTVVNGWGGVHSEAYVVMLS